jgi:protease IV
MYPPPPPSPFQQPLAAAPSVAPASITINGSFWRGAVGAVTGLLAIGLVFLIGLVVGLGGGVAMGGAAPLQVVPVRGGSGANIAVIPVEGAIDERMAAFVDAAARTVLDNGGFDAVVLRVDSGGGGVTASDQISHTVGKLRAAGIPVVASFGGMAASGGYYISAGTDEIFAEPTTVTGSIGVIAQVFTMEGLADKVGIRPLTIVASGSPEKATANDIFRSWSDKDRAVVQKLLDVSHATFVKRVFDGRQAKLATIEAVEAIATGEVFDAERALAEGLVDSIGYLDDAIAAAEGRVGARAGSAAVYQIMAPIDLLGGLAGVSAAQAPLKGAADIRALASELATPRLRYQVQF